MAASEQIFDYSNNLHANWILFKSFKNIESKETSITRARCVYGEIFTQYYWDSKPLLERLFGKIPALILSENSGSQHRELTWEG